MSSTLTSTLKRRNFRLCALAVGLLSSGVALADAHLDPLLLSKMTTAAATDHLQVVVSYNQKGPVTPKQVAALGALGINKGLTMRTLPIAGALATPAEIRALSHNKDVVSIFFNAPLKYLDADASGLSGASRTTDNPADYNRTSPFTGKGVGVLLNDSGIDGTHADVAYGTHVVQNTQGVTNLASLSSLLPVTYIEGVINTDWGSGHGTHCAGIIGGTGERSGGLYKGVAPGASLIGYGSGAVLLILDAVGGLDYAATNQHKFDVPINVTSNSWGSSGAFDPLDPVNIASYELYKLGIVTVFAAGNDGPGEDTHNPYAQAPWVISVGASEKNGILTSFSSRGKRGDGGDFVMPDGVKWSYVNQPTIVAPGVDIISTRDSTGTLPALAAQQDADTLDPANLPFYTVMSGTSMATPHVAGIVALMFEANPKLKPAEVADIIKRTATNMTGRLAWEAGAGHINAYAAVAEAAGIRTGFGKTVNSLATFNSNELLVPGPADVPFSVDFAPVGTVGEQTFEVGKDTAWVSARAVIDANTLALVLTDPDGIRYGSAIALPVLGDTVTTGAAAKPGTWSITVRGIGSLSGTNVDPAGVTNGYAAPGTVTGSISFLNSGGYTGLSDVGSHPDAPAIEFAVANRLVDGYADGQFRPDQVLRRSELAQYLLMGTSVRQYLPFSGKSSFADLAAGSTTYAFAESAIAKGGPLRDLTQTEDGVMTLQSAGAFAPDAPVTRASLAYSLVQSLALQKAAKDFTGSLTAFHDGVRIPLDDAAAVPANLRGYVQLALDQGVLLARFAEVKGPYDEAPTLHAYFDPGVGVTRSAYAAAAGRYLSVYQTGL